LKTACRPIADGAPSSHGTKPAETRGTAARNRSPHSPNPSRGKPRRRAPLLLGPSTVLAVYPLPGTNTAWPSCPHHRLADGATTVLKRSRHDALQAGGHTATAAPEEWIHSSGAINEPGLRSTRSGYPSRVGLIPDAGPGADLRTQQANPLSGTVGTYSRRDAGSRTPTTEDDPCALGADPMAVSPSRTDKAISPSSGRSGIQMSRNLWDIRRGP